MSVQLTFFFVHYMFCVKRTTILSIFATANLMCAEQGPLMKRIYQDKTIRLGFASAITIGVLKQMGYKNIEPVVTDWSGLLPDLKFNGFDIVNSRCQIVVFSEPMTRKQPS